MTVLTVLTEFPVFIEDLKTYQSPTIVNQEMSAHLKIDNCESRDASASKNRLTQTHLHANWRCWQAPSYLCPLPGADKTNDPHIKE